jgi:hypothetical protein
MTLSKKEKAKKKYSKPVLIKYEPDDPRISHFKTLFLQEDKEKKCNDHQPTLEKESKGGSEVSTKRLIPRRESPP